MKKIILSFLVLSVAASVAVAQQSLGDAARKARAQKKAPATIHIEGEGAPVTDTPPTDSSRDTPADTATASPKPTADNKDDKTAAPKSAADTAKEKNDEWSAKIDAQKKAIALLQRELDVTTREQKLRMAAYYGDAGTQLRDSAKYAEDSRKEQEQIDAKKQALEQAQQKLADLQEEARKAGAHVSD